jgi:hypothetical protein
MEHDHMVQAFPPNGTNHPLDEGSLPGGAQRGQDLANAHVSYLVSEVLAEDGIAITQHVAREPVEGHKKIPPFAWINQLYALEPCREASLESVSELRAILRASRESNQKSTKKRLTNTLRKLIQQSLLMWCRRVTQIRAVTALLSTFVAVQAVGQAATGTLRGRVSDARGHTVGGAQVMLYSGTSPEVKATAVSDQLGQFEFIHLAPASDHRLRVTHSGYVSIEAAGISLRAGETKQLQITLDPQRALSNAVTEVDTVGVRQQVRALPVRGQASGILETLVPGASATGGTFGSFPINGSRAQFNTYIVSGTNNLDPFRSAEAIGQGGAFAAPAVLLPLDAIQEIEVQTNTGAEYGPSGAAVLTTIKNGGPRLHGSLFEFFDNDKLAANNFYNNAFGRRCRIAAISSVRMKGSTSEWVLPSHLDFPHSRKSPRQHRSFRELAVR